MADIWEDTGNGWYEPVVDTSYDQPRYAETVTRDIVTQRQDVGTSSNDQWGGFFQKALGGALNYVIKRDAAQTGVQLQQQQRAGMPNYYAPAAMGSRGLVLSPQLLIIGGVVAFLVLRK